MSLAGPDGGRTLPLDSAGDIQTTNGVTGSPGFARAAPAGSWRLSTALGCGTGGGAGAGAAAWARFCAATGPYIMMVRACRPDSAGTGAGAGGGAVAPAGGTGALGAAAGTEAGGATAGAEAAGTGWGRLGAGGDAGLAGTEVAAGFAGGAAGGTGALDAAAGGDAAAGFAGGAAADEVVGWDSDVAEAAGLPNPAGMGRPGGAAIPTMVLPRFGLSINFPVVGQVRVSGRCCFSQWGQGFTAGFTAGLGE